MPTDEVGTAKGGRSGHFDEHLREMEIGGFDVSGQQLVAAIWIAAETPEANINLRGDGTGGRFLPLCTISSTTRWRHIRNALPNVFGVIWIPAPLFHSNPQSAILNRDIQRETDMTEPTYEELKAQIAALESKKQSGVSISFKVSDKGGVSVYGLGRFPVTPY